VTRLIPVMAMVVPMMVMMIVDLNNYLRLRRDRCNTAE
jgi:hypothetical protein